MNPLATWYLKRWAGLARPADPARLFLPQNAGGLNLSLPSDLYQTLQVGKASLLISSQDGGVNHAISESLRKESIQQRAKFHLYTMVQEAFAANPGASGKAVARKAKQAVTNHLKNKRLEHSLSLDTQGKLFHLIDSTAPESAMWSKAIQFLPSAQMNFALNSATDTLPHNANLALWRKSHHLSAACKLCGERQTLYHILNNCRTVLELCRYCNNARHNLVLQAIMNS